MQQTKNSGDSDQFTIGSLFFWTAFIAVAILIVARPGAATLLVIPLVLIGMLLGTSRITFESAIGWSVSWLILSIFLVPSEDFYSRQTTRRPRCSNKMRQLSLALLNYESTHGHFPPAYTVDENGTRLHSWRTLILPYIEENHRYSKIDFSLPWNHPKNLQHALPVPEDFRCEHIPRGVDEAFTSYQAVVGNGCLFEHGGKKRNLFSITDGTSNTAQLIELVNHPVHWMSPHDIDYERFIGLLKKEPQTLLGAHPGGCNVARADGSVLFLRADVDPRVLRSALLIADDGPDDGF